MDKLELKKYDLFQTFGGGSCSYAFYGYKGGDFQEGGMCRGPVTGVKERNRKK